ncbi:hypothetical protein QTO34_013953 [Cnephaeus nilssonii]|uniref:Small ribosomal subunit protein eS25 n=1 Tax=Cnephaeus nilssonii TaxID=3371016 RepID=A0AA40I932_CNENI|nr:hypothetical protein QTO34_013953 [Eptesicus nilssonii]
MESAGWWRQQELRPQEAPLLQESSCNGPLVSNNQLLGKFERAIDLKLQGKDIGKSIEKGPRNCSHAEPGSTPGAADGKVGGEERCWKVGQERQRPSEQIWGKAKKKKWSKGKAPDKLNNLVLFDKATYDALCEEVPTYKLINPAVVSERLKPGSSPWEVKVRGSLDRAALQELLELASAMATTFLCHTAMPDASGQGFCEQHSHHRVCSVLRQIGALVESRHFLSLRVMYA